MTLPRKILFYGTAIAAVDSMAAIERALRTGIDTTEAFPIGCVIIRWDTLSADTVWHQARPQP